MGNTKTQESTKTLVSFLRNAVNRQYAPIGQYWGVIISRELAAEVADRLEAYDRTGYSPEDFDKLCREMSGLRMALCLDTYDDLRKIIQDDRLLVLPCAIGTPVYVHNALCDVGGRATFASFTDCKYAQDCQRNPHIKCPLRVVKRPFTEKMRKGLGRTFWLTKEEAEAAIPADRLP